MLKHLLKTELNQSVCEVGLFALTWQIFYFIYFLLQMNSHWLSLKVTFFFFFNYCAGKMLLSFICFVCVHFLSPGFTSYWKMVLDHL